MLMEKLPEFMGDEERYVKSMFSCCRFAEYPYRQILFSK